MLALQYAAFFQTLTPYTPFSLYEKIFAPEVRFSDPFQSVQGIKKVHHIFAHMYSTLKEPRFEVTQVCQNGHVAFISWEFHFVRGEKADTFEGVSKVRFNDEDLVIEHIDYWDAASNVYEKIPLLGWVLRRIKGMLRA